MAAEGVAGVLLAAGASRRLGRPKQLIGDASGVPAVVHFARAMRAAGCSPVLVVVGAHQQDVCRALAGEPVTIVHNAQWADGMGTSIAAGVHALQAESMTTRGVLVCPCDMPTVGAEHLRALLRAFDGMSRVASVYDDGDAGSTPVRGIPAILPSSDWAWLAALRGDSGARPLLRAEGVRLVSLAGGTLDLDTPDDLARWHARLATETHLPPPFLPTMPTLIQTVLPDLNAELASTRRMFERLPIDRLDFTPHEKSWPLGKLAIHLLDPPLWGEVTCTTHTLAFDGPMPEKVSPTTRDEFLAIWDARVAQFARTLATMTDASLQETWQATMGGVPVMSMPRIMVLRTVVLNHMIHHRAQLTMYYRLLDVPVPGMYGPSADEKGAN